MQYQIPGKKVNFATSSLSCHWTIELSIRFEETLFRDLTWVHRKLMQTTITKTNQLQKKWKPQQWAGISKIENHFLSVNWKLFKLNGQFSINQTWLPEEDLDGRALKAEPADNGLEVEELRILLAAAIWVEFTIWEIWLISVGALLAISRIWRWTDLFISK